MLSFFPLRMSAFGRSGTPVARRRRSPGFDRLEERRVLGPFPPNIQNNLGAYLNAFGQVNGFPTSVTPGETIHFSVTVTGGVDNSFDPVFGYPYLVISYAANDSVLLNGQQPDAPDGAEPVYYYPYTPGVNGPPDEPDPTVRSGDEQAVPLQGSTGTPIEATIGITAQIASDAPGGTVTETPSPFPNTLNAPGPWVFIVGDYPPNGDTTTLDAWSTAIPFVVAPDVPSFSTSTSSFFGTSSPTPTGVAGSALAPAVVVNVLKAGGAIDTGYKGNVTITLSGGASGASMVSSTGGAVASVTVPVVKGVATFSGSNAIIVNKVGTGYSLVASLTDGTPNSSPSFDIQGHTLKFSAAPQNSLAGDAMPVKVEVDSGSSIDSSFTGSVQLQLADASGNAINDPTVHFEDAGGTAIGTTLSTIAVGGTADFSKILYINKPGTYTLIASIPNDSNTPSKQSSSFTLGVHQVKVVLPSPMGGGPNETLPAVKVEVLDGQGNADPNYDSGVNLALNGGLASGQSNGATLAGNQVDVAAGSGAATFASLVINKTGQNYSLTATLDTDAAPRDISGKFAIGDTLKFLTQPPAAPAAAVPGEPLGTPPPTSGTATPVQVEVDDTTGNKDLKFAGAVSLALSANSFGGKLGGTSSTQVKNGVATFNTLSVDTVGSGYTLVASLPGDPDTQSVTSSAFNVVPHDLFFKQVLAAPPAKAGAAGSPLHGAGGAPIEVDAYDAMGNIDSGYTGTITLTLNIISQTNTDGKVATLLNSSGAPVVSIAVTGTAGRAGVLFPNVIISEPGRYSLTATAPEKGAPGGKITDTSGQFIVGSDTPVITNNPRQFSGVNEGIGGPVVVQVQNDSGQVDTSFTGNVVMTLLGLSNTGQKPTLGGTLTVPAQAGVATFTSLMVNQLGTGYQLEAKLVDGTASAPGDLFSIVPETLKFLETEFQNPAGLPGEPISQEIKVGAFLQTGGGSGGGSEDTVDTQFTNAGAPATLSLGQNAVGALLQNASVQFFNGVATFDKLSISKPSGDANPGFTLIASDGNSADASATSPPIVIVPHGLSFDFSFEPINSTVDTPMQQIIVVNVDGLNGQPDPNFNGPVTLTLDGGSVLGQEGDQVGSLTAKAISGRAHFPNPTIATPGTLVFSASIDEPGSDSAFSTTFRVSPASPVSQNLQASSSVVTAGGSITASDTLTVNQSSNAQARALVAPLTFAGLARSKPKPKGPAEPTGKVLFEDNGKVLARVKVQIKGSTAVARAKLKLKTPGVQTITAVYVPDASGKKLGLSAPAETIEVTVLPAPAKKKKR